LSFTPILRLLRRPRGRAAWARRRCENLDDWARPSTLGPRQGAPDVSPRAGVLGFYPFADRVVRE